MSPGSKHASGRTFRLGTRQSPLALAQAHLVRDSLQRAHPHLSVEIIGMTTSGDRLTAQNLADFGGKGLFTKELEEALLARRIDAAVHSAKDMQTVLPPGLILACTPEREDPRDVLILSSPEKEAGELRSLPPAAVLGTSSLRRAAQALHIRPDLRIVPLRGNVQTRLGKLAQGEAHATLLALAGLKRLNLPSIPGTPLDVAEMLPAVSQGALALECRADDECTHALLAPLHHAPTHASILCERALLRVLDGSCRTPIAALAMPQAGSLHLRALLLTPDGAQCWRVDMQASAADAETLGEEGGRKLLGASKKTLAGNQ